MGFLIWYGFLVWEVNPLVRQELDRHLGVIANAATNKTLKAAVGSTLAAYGFERWIYATENPCGAMGMPVVLSDGFGLWLLKYMANGYQAVDPLVAYSRTADEPLLWDTMCTWPNIPGKGQFLLRDLAAQNIGSGMAIPLRDKDGPQGLLNIVVSESLVDKRTYFEAVQPDLVEIGHSIHRTMVKIMKATGF